MQVEIGGRAVEVRIRRSQRARHALVSVASPELVEVALPPRVARRHVGEILAAKRAWIERQLERHVTLDERAHLLGLREPGVVWIHGEAVPIRSSRPAPGDATGWTARLSGGALVLRPYGHAARSCGREAAVLRWYRREARTRVGALVEREAAALDVSPAGVSIRDPRTRWGSCSATGRLSFSWRLLLAPLEVLDYVVVHELCHLRELNHSSTFWRQLERARPAYREQLRWLSEFGSELQRYRPLIDVGAPGAADALA